MKNFINNSFILEPGFQNLQFLSLKLMHLYRNISEIRL